LSQRHRQHERALPLMPKGTNNQGRNEEESGGGDGARENAGHSQGNGRRWVMNSECDEKLMDCPMNAQ